MASPSAGAPEAAKTDLNWLTKAYATCVSPKGKGRPSKADCARIKELYAQHQNASQQADASHQTLLSMNTRLNADARASFDRLHASLPNKK